MINSLKKLVKDLGHFVKEIWWVIRCNWHKELIFVLIYSVFNIFATTYIMKLVLKTVMSLRGVTYIGPDNLKMVFMYPPSLLILLIGVILLTLMSIFEIAGIQHAFSMGQIGKNTTLQGMAAAGLYTCKRSLHPKNWGIIIFIMVLMPLTGVLSFCATSISLVIPEFIRDAITANRLYNISYSLIYLVMLLIEITSIFALNFYVLEEKDFFQACRESQKLIQRKYFKTIIGIALASFIFFLISVSFSSILSEISIKLVSPFLDVSGTLTDKYRMVYVIGIIRDFLNGVVAPVINVAALTVLFYQYVEDEGRLVSLSKRSFVDEKLSKASVAIFSLILVGMIGFYAYDNRLEFETFNSEVQRPRVIAHRGESRRAPENSFPAFEYAMEEGVTTVELDVHQTIDDEIIISHDDDLKRISGQQIFVHESTYDEVMSLDVGSWFSEDFKGLQLTTLEETLKFFKEHDMSVIIEIKPTGFDVDIEKRVIEIIRDCDMVENSVITCLELDPLIRVKEIDPEIQTSYCMVTAWEDIHNVEAADQFSIEESNVTKEIIDGIHSVGKECLTWTVNSEDAVQYLVDCGVDGILTDDPIMMESALDKVVYTGGFHRLVRMLAYRISSGT